MTANRRPRPRRPDRAADESRLRGAHKATPYLLTGPSLLLIVVILVIPVGYAAYNSFFRAERFGAEPAFVGIDNYVDLLTSADFLASLGKTAIFVVGCLLLGNILALTFAHALNKAAKAMRFLRAVSIAPYIVSSVAAAVMFRILFNQSFGQVNQLLETVGLSGLPWFTDGTLAMFVVIVAQVWTDLPIAVLILLGGLQSIDQSIEDSAIADGASPLQRFWHVSVPMIAPQLAISTVWLSYATLTSLGVILSLTGGGPLKATHTAPMEMYVTAFDRLKYHEAQAIVIIILLLNAILTLLYLRLVRRYRDVDA